MRKRRATRKPVFVCDRERYDFPFHVFGKPSFKMKDFLVNPNKYKLVVLPGGEDLNPSIYGHRMHHDCEHINTERDAQELYVAWVARKANIPVVGICRGAQLLNAMAGGEMVQHCDNHRVWHNIRTSCGKLLYVSSTHHQMMVPGPNAEVLAWAEPRRSPKYFGRTPRGKMPAPEVEMDCVYYPGLSFLAIQFHPEYMKAGSPAARYAQHLVETKLGIEKVSGRQRGNFISLPKRPYPESLARFLAQVSSKMPKKARIELEFRMFAENFLNGSFRTQRCDRRTRARTAREKAFSHLTSIHMETLQSGGGPPSAASAAAAAGASE